MQKDTSSVHAVQETNTKQTVTLNDVHICNRITNTQNDVHNTYQSEQRPRSLASSGSVSAVAGVPPEYQ